jgi:hypothetical protein
LIDALTRLLIYGELQKMAALSFDSDFKALGWRPSFENSKIIPFRFHPHFLQTRSLTTPSDWGDVLPLG